jgi:potassium-dependent mechanosensitive channel
VEGRPAHSLVTALRAVPSFASVDESTLLEIVGDSVNLRWRVGSTLFRSGSPADGLYVVLAGAVRVLNDDGDVVAVLRPGEFFGEFSLLLGTAHQQTVEAVEDAELMVVSKERFDELLAADPELSRSIRTKAEERLAANVELAARRS